MIVNRLPDLSGVEKQVKKSMEELRKKKWYQKPLGMILLGVVAGLIVATLFYLL